MEHEFDSIAFVAPDAYAELGDNPVEATSDVGWRNAVSFHEKLRRSNDPLIKMKVQDSAVRAILHKARNTLGSLTHPYDIVNRPWSENLAEELDLDASLEESPILDALMIEKRQEHRAEVVVCLDTSLSMTGRKLAILGVAVGAIALQVRPEDLCIINFESEAHVVKPLGSRLGPLDIVTKFIESPAKGLTNMESALKAAIRECNNGRQRKRAVILMSDGRFTAGGRPEYLIPQLPKLHVVQTGNPWSNNRFFKRMARLGNGKFVHVSDFEHLPRALYALVREILR